MISTPITGSAFRTAQPRAAGAGGLAAWLLSEDPARQAARHLALAATFMVLALAAALPLRLELLTPQLDLLDARSFGALLSLHATLMFYFVALPAFPAVLGYALLPEALGTSTMAFPRLMAMSWALLLAGGATVIVGFLAGGTEAGWSFDFEFGGRFDSVGLLPMAIGIFLAAVAVVVTAVNIIATIVQSIRYQAAVRPMNPLVSSMLYAGVCAMVAGPFLACCALVVMIDGSGWVSLFDPATGGDPLLFKMLLRLFVSPAKSMVLVAAFGTVISVVAARTQGRSNKENRTTNLLLALLAAGGIGAWTGTETSASTGMAAQDFSFLLCAVAVVAGGSLVMRTVMSLRRGILTMDAPMVYALGFVAMAVPILGAGLAMAIPAAQALLGNTAFATAQLHLQMVSAIAMAFLAGLHEAWPRLTGRSFADRIASGAAAGIVVGTLLSFGPPLLLGLRGASFRANEYLPEFQVLQVLATAGMTLLVAALFVACVNLVFARRLDGEA